MDCKRCDGVGWRWVPDARGKTGWAWAFCVTCQATGSACVRALSEHDHPPRVRPRPVGLPADLAAEAEEVDAA
jgi:hypothetical protein